MRRRLSSRLSPPAPLPPVETGLRVVLVSQRQAHHRARPTLAMSGCGIYALAVRAVARVASAVRRLARPLCLSALSRPRASLARGPPPGAAGPEGR